MFRVYIASSKHEGELGEFEINFLGTRSYLLPANQNARFSDNT